MPRAEREIIINASAERVFEVIADYERYPEFLPEMKSVQVLSKADGVALVRFDLELVMRISYTLRLQEDRPRALSWTLDKAKVLTINSGGWQLRENPGGGTLALYGIDLKMRGIVPKAVTTRLAAESLPTTLGRFKNRIESHEAASN